MMLYARLAIVGIIALSLGLGGWRVWSISKELTTLRSEREQILSANDRLARELIRQAESHQRQVDAIRQAYESEAQAVQDGRDSIERIMDQEVEPLSPAGRIFIQGARQ